MLKIRKLTPRTEFEHYLYSGIPAWYPKGVEVAGENNFCIMNRIRLDQVPQELVSIDQPSRVYDKPNTGAHFYIEDSKFRSVIEKPNLALKKIVGLKCILTPDITIASELAKYQKISRTSLARMVGAYFQSRQIVVIPSLRWTSLDDFDFLLDGIPQGSVFAVSSVGVARNADDRRLFEAGVMIAIDRLNPVGVMIYGSVTDEFASEVLSRVTLFRFYTPTSKLVNTHVKEAEPNDLFAYR